MKSDYESAVFHVRNYANMHTGKANDWRGMEFAWNANRVERLARTLERKGFSSVRYGRVKRLTRILKRLIQNAPGIKF